MHILTEGLIPHELQLLLASHISVDHFYTLDQLNQFIKSFPFSTSESRDKPNVINGKFDVHTSQTSAQILILARILPLFIGQHVTHDEIHYANFLLLLQIMQLSLSPFITADSICDFEEIVDRHNSSFMELYPTSFIPKHHFLIHLIGQMKKFGPLKNHYCFAFEAKHNVVKSVRWYNFVNISLSVSKYLQYNTIANLINDEGSLVAKPFSAKESFFKNRVEIDSIVYRVGDIICFASLAKYSFFEIIRLEDSTKAHVIAYRTVQYISNKMAYHIVPTENEYVLRLTDLKIPWPVTKLIYDGIVLIVPRSVHRNSVILV